MSPNSAEVDCPGGRQSVAAQALSADFSDHVPVLPSSVVSLTAKEEERGRERGREEETRGGIEKGREEERKGRRRI